jgi:hypothetical protein
LHRATSLHQQMQTLNRMLANLGHSPRVVTSERKV